jgi:hypothetical protein
MIVVRMSHLRCSALFGDSYPALARWASFRRASGAES